MKKVILALSASVMILSAQAQISIAPEVGVNLANMSIKDKDFGSADNTKMKTGLKVGAVVTIPVAKGFFVQPGAFYSMKGTRFEESETFMGQELTYKYSINPNYLEIPVNLGYEYSFGKAGGVFVTAGPYLGYAFGGKYKAEGFLNGNSVAGTDESDDIEFGSGDNDDMKPLDFGLNFSAGYKLPVGVYVRAQYGLGLSNLSNYERTTIKNNVLSFSVGYAFKF